jgi:hypothetical protein
MDYSAFIDLSILNDDAKKELELFYKYLLFKYRKKGQNGDSKKQKAERLLTFADKNLIHLPKDYNLFNSQIQNRIEIAVIFG